MFNSCSSPRWDTLSRWLVLRQKQSQAFFFPIPTKTLVESQPVIAWNPGRDQQSSSPKAWAMWCTGIICCRSFNRNHNSGHPKLLKWLTLRIRTSVCSDWMTSRLSVLAAYLACNIILVSASSWFDRSAWTPLHWPLVTVTAFSPSLKPPSITRSFCGGSWCSPSLQSTADGKLHRLTC